MIHGMFELNSIKPILLDDKGLQQALLRLDQLTSGMERGSLGRNQDKSTIAVSGSHEAFKPNRIEPSG